MTTNGVERPLFPRSSGVLLHPTSLPGPYGIGDLGDAAFAWIDFLAEARQSWWQFLPLGPVGPGNSPYQSTSAFAGNPHLISPDLLVRDGLLDASDITGVNLPEGRVDYGAVFALKHGILERAWLKFRHAGSARWREPFDVFRQQHAKWLDDFALFLAIKESQGGVSWMQWPEDIRLRKPIALKRARKEMADRMELFQFGQFLFFRQWNALREYAHQKQIKLIGDIPIFVAGDSADVWAHTRLFQLDKNGQPTAVAGVPPDYFSETGQLWGNPLYEWQELRKTRYAWWLARFRATLEQVDVIRLDHFRGFEAYWKVAAGKETAIEGEWIKAPGEDFLATMERQLGGLPLIAEDLGIITPEVEALRDHFHLPGMRILQFAFGGAPENRFLPHNYEHNTVVYTGTHDNDTTRGWYASLTVGEADFLRRYLARHGDDVTWDLIRAALASVGNLVIIPLQDILDLGSEGRMNFPGKPTGNWEWRFTTGVLTSNHLSRLRDLTELYSRDPRVEDTRNASQEKQ